MLFGILDTYLAEVKLVCYSQFSNYFLYKWDRTMFCMWPQKAQVSIGELVLCPLKELKLYDIFFLLLESAACNMQHITSKKKKKKYFIIKSLYKVFYSIYHRWSLCDSHILHRLSGTAWAMFNWDFSGNEPRCRAERRCPARVHCC